MSRLGEGEWHVGRSFTGHHIEDDCPCPKAACGLVIFASILAACEQHAVTQTIRQSHPAELCPALGRQSGDAPLYVCMRVEGYLPSAPSEQRYCNDCGEPVWCDTNAYAEVEALHDLVHITCQVCLPKYLAGVSES